MYLLTSSILFQKDSSYKCQLCTKVLRTPPRLISQVYAWVKCKDEVPDASGSDQDIETSCNTKLKTCVSKVQKNQPRKIYVIAIL